MESEVCPAALATGNQRPDGGSGVGTVVDPRGVLGIPLLFIPLRWVGLGHLGALRAAVHPRI